MNETVRAGAREVVSLTPRLVEPATTRQKRCTVCGREKRTPEFRIDMRTGSRVRVCQECEHIKPPGIPGPCPDCGTPVLLWTTDEENARITLLESTHIVTWVEDIAIGPTLRAGWPVHLCEKTAPLTAYQRAVIDFVWANGETTMNKVMDARAPRQGMTWAEGRAEIDALCPGWLDIVYPSGRAKRRNNLQTLVRYIGPGHRDQLAEEVA